jgi:hypothetical protein
MPSGGASAVYCYGDAYGSPCLLQFNSASPGVSTSVAQDVQVYSAPGDNWTIESAVRCASPSPCPIRLALWGLDPTESARVSYATLPNDRNWYICRMNYDHGGSAAFNSAHSKLRWEVYNDTGGGNIDIDYTTLAKYSISVRSTQGDLAEPGQLGTPCTLYNRFNGQ